MKNQVSQNIYRESMGYYCSSAAEFIKLIQDNVVSIPAEYRESAKVDFNMESDYGSEYCYLEISYLRPETDQEEAERIQREAARHELVKARELRELQALQAKYGTKP